MSDKTMLYKGMPAGAATTPLAEIGALGLRILDDDLALPAAVFRRSALNNNSRWMRDFTGAHGLSFAPHAKTTMSPELIQRQLADGAWGIKHFWAMVRPRPGIIGQAAHGAVDLGMAEKNLDGSEIAGRLVDDRRFRPPQ